MIGTQAAAQLFAAATERFACILGEDNYISGSSLGSVEGLRWSKPYCDLALDCHTEAGFREGSILRVLFWVSGAMAMREENAYVLLTADKAPMPFGFGSLRCVGCVPDRHVVGCNRGGIICKTM